MIVEHNYKKLYLRIISLLRIFIISLVYFSIVDIYVYGLNRFVSFIFQFNTYWKFLIFNAFQNNSITPLWFLMALIYCYLICIILLKLKSERIFYFGSVLLLLSIVIKDCLCVFFDINIILTRNWIFIGIPFFSIGLLIKKYKDKIFNNKLFQPELLLIIGLCLFFFQYSQFKLTFFSNSIIAVSIFLLTFKKNVSIGNMYLSMAIQDISLYIYIIHCPIRDILIHNDLCTNDWLMPIIVLFLSIIISIIVFFLKIIIRCSKCNGII